MSEKKRQTENTKTHKPKPPYKGERQSWTVPNIPPVARPIPETPVQDNPKPESSKPEFQPQIPKPVDTPKPQPDKPKK